MSVHLIADILFVLLGALIIWRCASNGFVKCLFKFVRTVLSIVLAYLLVSPVAPIIAEKFIHDPVYDYVYDKINGIYMEAEESLETSNIVEQFPDFLITEELEDKLENMDEAGEELVLSVSEEITAPIVKIVSSVIAFVLLFILIFILLSIVMALLNSLINKIKLIHLANTLLGLAWGILVAVILWCLISTVMNLLFSDLAIYEESVVIKFFGESNLLDHLGILELGEDLLHSVFD